MELERLRTIIRELVPHAKLLAAAIKRNLGNSWEEERQSGIISTALEQLKVRIEAELRVSAGRLKRGEFSSLIVEFIAFASFASKLFGPVDSGEIESRVENVLSVIFPPSTIAGNIFEAIRSEIPPAFYQTYIVPFFQSVDSVQVEKDKIESEAEVNLFSSEFLKFLNPKLAKKRGVINTPPDIVDTIVGGANDLLKRELGVSGGILSDTVEILDPSSGTLAFPLGILRFARQHLKFHDLSHWFHKIFLNRVHGFEVRPAAYCIALSRITLAALELGTQLKATEKPSLFLVNTLADDICEREINSDPQVRSGLELRDNCPIAVVIGNPPYNVSTQNKSPWIVQKIETYKANLQRMGTKRVSGLKNIQNDYVKFIRFAQWRIERTGYGVVGFVTPNYFLDGLVFRGMRCALRNAFDEIDIINLHGDMYRGIERRARALGVHADENVFGIREGICILFLLKKAIGPVAKCRVRYCETWGTVPEKFEFIRRSFMELPFEEIQDHSDYIFVPPKITPHDSKYATFSYLPDIFTTNIQGIVTGHDTLVSHVDRQALENIIDAFYNRTFEELPLKSGKQGHYASDGGVKYADARDWTIAFALKGTSEKAKRHIIRWAYRGFDQRWLAYDEHLLTKGITRFKLMQYLLPGQNNITLVVNRQSLRDIWSSAFVTDCPFDNKMAEGARGLHSYAFPLKISSQVGPDDFEMPKNATDSNLSQSFTSQLPFVASDEQIFYYIYGIFNTPLYRTRYAARLCEDFPRVPFPNVHSKFHKMAELGMDLVKCHLLHNYCPNEISFKYHLTKKSISVENFKYDPQSQRIYFHPPKTGSKSSGDWIEGIDREIWEFKIGGIPQLQQWLKARKHRDNSRKNCLCRSLRASEMKDFLKICQAIAHTLALGPSLDEVYQEIDSE